MHLGWRFLIHSLRVVVVVVVVVVAMTVVNSFKKHHNNAAAPGPIKASRRWIRLTRHPLVFMVGENRDRQVHGESQVQIRP